MNPIKLKDTIIKLEKPLGEFTVRKRKDGQITYDSGLQSNMIVNGFYSLLAPSNTTNYIRTWYFLPYW